jgi:hypothetical protein
MIGPECYETALEFVRRKAISQQIWIASQNALFGIVNGRHGDHYTPTVYFSRQGPVPVVKAVRCNCAASYGCEHAAALVIAAVTGGTATGGLVAGGTGTGGTGTGGTGTGGTGTGGTGTGGRGDGALAVPRQAPRQAPRRHAWDASLESWLTAGREAGGPG